MIWAIVVLFVFGDAYVNYLRIEHGNKINHVFNAAYRVAFYVILIFLYHMPILQAVVFLLGSFFLAWLLFNIALNYLRHRPLDYLGKDSLLDRFEAKLPWIVWLIWKVIAASGFIYAYYFTSLL